MTDPKHTTIKDFTPNKDGSMTIETQVYYEQLASAKREVEKRTKTNHTKFLADLMACAKLMKEQKSREVTITIHGDEALEPYLLVSKYTTYKENFGRRSKKY